MAERPIEEVIGWELLPVGWKIPGPDLDHYYRDAATVDDLAAWLDAWWIEVVCEDPDWDGQWWKFEHDQGEDGRLFWFVDPIDDDPDEPAHPTALAALTAAVRKVAGHG